MFLLNGIWVTRYILLQHLSIVFSFLSFLPQKKETKKVTAAPSFSANRATATTASVISSFLRAQKLLSSPAASICYEKPADAVKWEPMAADIHLKDHVNAKVQVISFHLFDNYIVTKAIKQNKEKMIFG